VSIDASDAFAYGIGTDGPIGLTITSCCSQRGTTIDNPIPTAVLSLCVVFGVGHDVFGNISVVSCVCGVFVFSNKINLKKPSKIEFGKVELTGFRSLTPLLSTDG